MSLKSENSFHEQRPGRIAMTVNSSKESLKSVDLTSPEVGQERNGGEQAGNEMTQFCLWLFASFYLTQGMGGLWQA